LAYHIAQRLQTLWDKYFIQKHNPVSVLSFSQNSGKIKE